jgi:GNAT superfamily N-acetyltransferase
MITIRKADHNDIGEIIGFQKQMAWETEKLALDESIVSRGVEAIFLVPSRGQYYVAEDSGKVIASLLITTEWSDWRNKEVWWFQSVYVLPGYRRKGVFRSMYSFIKELAERSDVAGLRLYVETNNLSARSTYESLGMNGDHYRLFEWLREY